MEELLETAEIDDEGFIELENGLKIKALDLIIAVEDNKAVERDLNKRIKITEVGVRDFGYGVDKKYLERLRAELIAFSDGHVSYEEANELKNNVSDDYLGITRFEHNNMRTVLNKNWEHEALSADERKKMIKKITDGESYWGEKWKIVDKSLCVYHSPKGDGSDIYKFVSESGREVIFDIETEELINSPNYIGTFNYSTSIDHWTLDMIPYWKWKNNAMDDSDLTWRLHPVIYFLFNY